MTRRKNKVSRTIAELTRIPVLTVDQTAQLIGCSETTIRRRLKSGTVTGKILNNRWHIPSMQFLLPTMHAHPSGDVEIYPLSNEAQPINDGSDSCTAGEPELTSAGAQRKLRQQG